MGLGFAAVAIRNRALSSARRAASGVKAKWRACPTDPHIQAFSGFAALNGRTQAGERCATTA
jgi:hypothetical protein